jgi:hypothetical protein
MLEPGYGAKIFASVSFFFVIQAKSIAFFFVFGQSNVLNVPIYVENELHQYKLWSPVPF